MGRLDRAEDVAGRGEHAADADHAEAALDLVDEEHVVRVRRRDDRARALAAQRKHHARAAEVRAELLEEVVVEGVRRLRVDLDERHARELGDHGLRRALVHALVAEDVDVEAAGGLLLEALGAQDLLARRDPARHQEFLERGAGGALVGRPHLVEVLVVVVRPRLRRRRHGRGVG